MLLTTDEILDAIEKVHEGDPKPFIEGLFVVASKYGELVPFKFNRLQERMHEARTGHDYWLKYRQGGSSLYHLAVSTANAICTPYFNTACITLSPTAAAPRSGSSNTSSASSTTCLTSSAHPAATSAPTTSSSTSCSRRSTSGRSARVSSAAQRRFTGSTSPRWAHSRPLRLR